LAIHRQLHGSTAPGYWYTHTGDFQLLEHLDTGKGLCAPAEVMAKAQLAGSEEVRRGRISSAVMPNLQDNPAQGLRRILHHHRPACNAAGEAGGHRKGRRSHDAFRNLRSVSM
jgi:hypothetical protein